MGTDLLIGDLSTAGVLAVLYNATIPFGAGILHYRHEFLDLQAAQGLLEDLGPHPDYHRGRRLKLDLAASRWNPDHYDQVVGPGVAAKALELLRQFGRPDHPQVQQLHRQNLQQAIRLQGWTKDKMKELDLPEMVRAIEFSTH